MLCHNLFRNLHLKRIPQKIFSRCTPALESMSTLTIRNVTEISVNLFYRWRRSSLTVHIFSLHSHPFRKVPQGMITSKGQWPNKMPNVSLYWCYYSNPVLCRVCASALLRLCSSVSVHIVCRPIYSTAYVPWYSIYTLHVCVCVCFLPSWSLVLYWRCCLNEHLTAVYIWKSLITATLTIQRCGRVRDLCVRVCKHDICGVCAKAWMSYCCCTDAAESCTMRKKREENSSEKRRVQEGKWRYTAQMWPPMFTVPQFPFISP